MNSRVAPCLERTILPSVTGTVNRVAVVVAHPDALRAIQLSLSTRRTPTALADAMMRPGGPPRVVTVDRSGRYITAESVNLPPLPHLPLRHSSNSSTGSTATESSIATPPPSIHVAAPELAGSSKTTIEQHVKDHETYHDAELYIPLVSKPASGSRFIEGSLAALDPRIVIPGRRESWRNPISVNDASTFHGAQVSSVIRLAA